jgi:FkbM family methyltransferase
MNPIWLARNLQKSIKVCPSWRDRIQLLLWTYSYKLPRWSNRKQNRRVSFVYPDPVGRINVIVRANDGSDAFIFSEVFDHRYYDFPLPFTPQTIMDLGANIGFTSIYFARKYPSAKIACVEPMPQNVQLLSQNLEMNNVQANIFPAAVAIGDGRICMEIAKVDYGHKVAGITYGKSLKGEKIKVDAISVSSLLQQLNWKRIDLLKIDIEGYEGILLKENCDWLYRVDAVCIECHEGYGEADLKEVAKSFGFDPPLQLPGTSLLVRKMPSD